MNIRLAPLAIAAEAHHLPERTLRRWVALGRLTAIKEGRTVLIDLRELYQLVELRHAAGGRLGRTPKWPYDSVESVDCSPDTQAPPSTRPR